MPLTRFEAEYLVAREGITFMMADEGGNAVHCLVSHKALRDLADRLSLREAGADLFETYRELIEQVASDAYDAEAPLDSAGRVVVPSEAIARVMRSA